MIKDIAGAASTEMAYSEFGGLARRGGRQANHRAICHIAHLLSRPPVGGLGVAGNLMLPLATTASDWVCGAGWARTSDLPISRQALFPAELRPHIPPSRAIGLAAFLRLLRHQHKQACTRHVQTLTSHVNLHRCRR